MAQPMMCDTEDGNPAVLLVTNLETGDANAWCPQCVPDFIRQMAQATGLLDAEYERGVNETTAKLGSELAGRQSKARGKGAGKASAPQDTDTVGESTDAPETEAVDRGERWAATVAAIETDETGHPL